MYVGSLGLENLSINNPYQGKFILSQFNSCALLRSASVSSLLHYSYCTVGKLSVSSLCHSLIAFSNVSASFF